MDIVLDLDLDFFVWPIANWPDGSGRLPDSECELLASDTEVRQFLEKNCHLARCAKISGQEFVEHEEAFCVWRRWLREGKLTASFDVIHVDAHADLGLGDSGWTYLVEEVLALPVAQRDKPQFGTNAINSSNYLTFAIANHWIRDLTYVFPTDRSSSSRAEAKPNDLMRMHFRNCDPDTGLIELKQYRREDRSCVASSSSHVTPLHSEPPVPFHLKADVNFKVSGVTHVVVAQSPKFTPISADRLLPIIREYFRPD